MARQTDRNIYKQGRYYHVTVTANGWRHKRSTRSTSIKDARVLLTKLTARANAGLPLDDEPEKAFEPLLDILRGFIGHTHYRKGAEAANRYRNAFVHIERRLGNPRVNTLTKEQIDRYITARLGEAAAPSVQKEMTLLAAAFSWAGKRVPGTPLKGCKVEGGDYARQRLLRQWEIDRLLQECAKSTILDHFLVALYTGMRKGELRRMAMRDIDFQTGSINIPKTKTGNPRVIHMHQAVKEILYRRRSDNQAHRPFHSPVNLNRPFNRAVKRAGLHDVRWHDLRRAMASYMFMTGSDLLSVMTQGGWKTASVVTRIYGQVTPEHVREQVGRLDFGDRTGTSIEQIPTPERREIEVADL